MAAEDSRSGTETMIAVLKRGSLYIDRPLYERYFPGLEAVILLRRENDLLIMPVRHAASGGYLLKLRNAAGDRVVNAMDFFREQGMDEFFTREIGVEWSSRDAALIGTCAFKNVN